MATNYVQPGAVFDYVNTGAAIQSGDVVAIGSVLGVAKGDIAAGGVGSVQTTGVFILPKDGSAAAQGEALTWDKSAGKFGTGVTPAKGDILGAAVAFTAAAAGDTAVQVRLSGTPGAVHSA